MIKGSFKFYAFCSSLAVFLSAPSDVLGMQKIHVKSKDRATTITLSNEVIERINAFFGERSRENVCVRCLASTQQNLAQNAEIMGNKNFRKFVDFEELD